MSGDASICARDTITVSVVIATLNRPALLDRCLGALVRQTLPMEQFEIIVVDDGPHAATEGVVRDWVRRCPGLHGLYRVAGPAHGPAAARNVGWRTARGAIIAFTDDDCIPDAGWLAAGLRALTDSGCGCSLGTDYCSPSGGSDGLGAERRRVAGSSLCDGELLLSALGAGGGRRIRRAFHGSLA